MSDIVSKLCPECNQTKPADDFYRQPKGGLQRLCKECVKARQKARYIPKREPIILPEGHKRCSRCKQDYPATEEYFYSNKSRRDRLNYLCKACHQEYEKARIQQSPKESLPETFVCVKCGREKPATAVFFLVHRQMKFGLDSTCKVCRNVERREYYRTHPEDRRHQSEYLKNLSEEIKERRRVRVREWHHKNREHLNRRSRVYRKTEKEKARRRVEVRNRYALKKHAPGKHTPQQIKEQYIRQKGQCYWCNTDLREEVRTPHIDHVTPLSRGGSNDIGNIVIACHRCNESRNNRLPHEWGKGGRLL